MRAKRFLGAFAALLFVANVQAKPFGFWADDGWSMIADDDGVTNSGFVDPGWGGQDFDAEYLYYKLNGSTLSLGLQTGFNLVSGKVRYGWSNYYAGDLALGVNGSYDYAIDFGLKTKDYRGNTVDADNDGDGEDEAGLYAVSRWNNNILFRQSAPYAMDEGTLISKFKSDDVGYSYSLDSYFRTVAIDLNDLGVDDVFDLSLHWTMSCGNDVVEGTVTVPEPVSGGLLVAGLLGLWLRRKSLRKG